MPELVERTAHVTMERKLELALAAVLRKIGMVGKVTPGPEQLCRLARDYAEHRNRLVSADDGRVVELAPPPGSKINESTPF